MLKAIPGHAQPIPMMMGHLEHAGHSLNNMKQMCCLLTNSKLTQDLLPRLEAFGQKMALLKESIRTGSTIAVTPDVTTQLTSLAQGIAEEVYALYIWVIQATSPENESEATMLHEGLAGIEEHITNEGTPVFSTISALKALRNEAPDSLKLLYSTSFLEMENIPMDLFLNVEQKLRPLEEYGLLQVNGEENTFSIHPIAHKLIQKMFPSEDRRIYLHALYEQFDQAWRFDNEDRDTWQATRPLLPHLVALIRSTPTDDIPLLAQSAVYLNELGLYLTTVELNFNYSIWCHKRALAIRSSLIGENDPSMAESLHNLGKALQAAGDNHQALQYYGDAAYYYLRLFGSSHPSVAETYNDIGALLELLGAFDKAERFYTVALDSTIAFDRNENDTDVAKCYTKLGNVQLKQGKFVEARSHYERAVEIQNLCYDRSDNFEDDAANPLTPEEYPYLATLYNNLAFVLLTLGEPDEAKRYEGEAQFYIELIES